MKRKALTVLAACGLCAFGIAVGAYAATTIQEIKAELRPDFFIVIDGQERTFKNAAGDVVYPILYEGTTYLPIRAIGELMGKTVYWYEDAKRIELKDPSTTVTDADVIVPSGQDQTQIDQGNTSGAQITEDKAKEIALQKAGLTAADVQFTKVKLDKDDGVLHYEIEFKQDKVKYSADVSASDGAVISWEVEGSNGTTANQSQSGDIGLDRAKEIALNKAGFAAADVRFTEQKTDYEKGQKVYDIEFVNGLTEYSAEILASDGTVLSWDVDRD